MNTYQQSPPNFLESPTSDVSSGIFPISSDVVAFLDVVIPPCDVLLPPNEMTVLTCYGPFEHPPSSFEYQTQERCGYEWCDGGVKSVADPSGHFYQQHVEVAACTAGPVLSIASEIEPTPFLRPDLVFADADDLVTPLEMFVEAFMPLFQDESGKCSPCNKPRHKCVVSGCNTRKQSNGRCIRHGGGKRCMVEGCLRGAQTMGRCKRHGGGARCTVEGCGKSSQSGGLCRSHGGGKLCIAPGCKKGAQRQGKCATHASRRCAADGCTSSARCQGFCRRHQVVEL